TYLTTPEVTKESATVAIKVSVDNQTTANADVTIKTLIYELGADGKRTGSAVAIAPAATLKIPAGQSQFNEAKLSVKNPKLWNLQEPKLYVAVTTLTQRGKAVDSYETVFGIRTIKFDAQQG